jgi:hypothetical protein
MNVSCECIGYATEDYTPVLNFGYYVDIERFDRRSMSYVYIRDLDEQSGKSTKQYFDDPGSRATAFAFIKNSLQKYLSTTKPPIVVRGPMTDFKKQNKRYTDITEIFIKNGYQKIVVPAREMSYKPNKKYIDDEEHNEYWFFVRKNIEVDKLKKIIPTN